MVNEIKFRVKKYEARWHNENWMSTRIVYVPQYKLVRSNRYVDMQENNCMVICNTKEEAQKFLSGVIERYGKNSK